MSVHVPCPVCTSHCNPFDVVDFNKSCEELRGDFLPLSGIPVYYFFCDVCKFCFAPEFSQWSSSDFAAKIYNSDYILVDPDYLTIRPKNNATTLIDLFGNKGAAIKHLDYGGGNGALSLHLRNQGWNSRSFDPYVDPESAITKNEKFDLITAFEVFEHVPNVKELVESLSLLLKPEGLLLFSTLLSNNQIHPNRRLTWWYASPRNGHISLFSLESLTLLARQAGLTLRSFSPGFHAVWNKLPPWAESVICTGHAAPGSIAKKSPYRPFIPTVEMTQSPYGRMLFPSTDNKMGQSFRAYGQFGQSALDLLAQFVGPGSVVLDIGANIGAHTVPLAQLVGSGGVVVAFEPQPVTFQILCSNLVLNSIPNVLTNAVALGNFEGECLVSPLPISIPGYSAESDPTMEGDLVPMNLLDGFQLERVDFIKLSVGGSAAMILEGAAQTIQRCRPIMYIEIDRADQSSELIQRLFDLGYRLWWHTPSLFSPNNIKGNPENVFPGVISINMLAIHRDMRPIEGLKPILTCEDTWQ